MEMPEGLADKVLQLVGRIPNHNRVLLFRVDLDSDGFDEVVLLSERYPGGALSGSYVAKTDDAVTRGQIAVPDGATIEASPSSWCKRAASIVAPSSSP